MSIPSYRLINPQVNRSFVLKWEPFDLTTRWHYHPELELIYFIKGKTNGVIGDGYREFEEGDLVLLGANFPHVLQENKEFSVSNPNENPFGLILQFTEGFAGQHFFDLPEMEHIKKMFSRAHRGLYFKGALKAKVCEKLKNIPHIKDPAKLLLLLDILNDLAEGDENQYEYLTNQDYYFNYSNDEERMWRVHDFIYKHFTEKITVADVASVANMTETSFCRYFKARTLKNFTQFLNEIRVSYSCRMLKKKNNSVSMAATASGFNNIPYYCRTFKKIMKMSPYDYKKQSHQKEYA